ncbi:MAG: TonB-dependent receptor [Pseudomonadota bacterium]
MKKSFYALALLMTPYAIGAFAEEADLKVTVTASRFEQNIAEIGSSVTILDKETLEKRGDRSVADALKRVQGVTLSRAGGIGSVSSIRLRGSDQGQVLVLIDGIDVGDPASIDGSYDFDSLLVSTVERIEIIRGNQSALYGSKAIGGVINIITHKTVKDGVSGTAFAEAGSFGTKQGGFNIAAGDEDMSFYVNATHLDRDGFSRAASGNENDSTEDTNINGGLTLRPTDNIELGANGGYIHLDAEIDGFPSPSFVLADTEDESEKDFYFGNIYANVSAFDGRLDNRLTLGGSRTERDSSGSSFDGDRFEAIFQSNLKLRQRDVLSLGADYDIETAETSNIDADVESKSIYGQYLLGLGQNITLTLGGRIDHFDNFGSNETYRAGIAYVIPESMTTIRGTYGTGFKAPTLFQLFSPSFGNTNLNPEESKGFDFGFEQTFPGEYVTIGATYFETEIDNLIGFTSGYVNINEAEISGWETFIEIDPTDSLSIYANYTYTDAMDITNNTQLLRRPKHQAAFGADIDITEDFRFGVQGLFVGEQQDRFNVSNSSFFTADINTAYGLTENVELYARADNILDRDYQEVVGYNAPGISAYGGLRVRF